MPSVPLSAFRPPGPLSRRRLLALALAGAAAPLGAALGAAALPGRAAADPTDDAYQKAFAAALAADQNVGWHRDDRRGYLYRPQQLLVADVDLDRVVDRLRRYGHRVERGAAFAGVTQVLLLGTNANVPALVDQLRRPGQWEGGRVPQVQPHHVLIGFGNIMGNPGSPPLPAAGLTPPDPLRAHEGAGVAVGVCDTGMWDQAGAYHPDWLGGSYLPEADDEDPVYQFDNVLALQGGHGTFVAGVVRQAAPGVWLDPEQALDATGVGDEQSLVAALGRLGQVSVVNLSLGGFTHGDVPPLPVANAIADLPAGTVVVAAAGNTGGDRPTWPAALDTVVAVAAVQPVKGEVEPAPSSARGLWVDACAVGVRTSTYVKGKLLLPGIPDQEFSGFASWAGTSFATAHVSGRLAVGVAAHGMDAEAALAALLAGPELNNEFGVFVP